MGLIVYVAPTESTYPILAKIILSVVDGEFLTYSNIAPGPEEHNAASAVHSYAPTDGGVAVVVKKAGPVPELARTDDGGVVFEIEEVLLLICSVTYFFTCHRNDAELVFKLLEGNMG